jgi:hypothetical protein
LSVRLEAREALVELRQGACHGQGCVGLRFGGDHLVQRVQPRLDAKLPVAHVLEQAAQLFHRRLGFRGLLGKLLLGLAEAVHR